MYIGLSSENTKECADEAIERLTERAIEQRDRIIVNQTMPKEERDFFCFDGDYWLELYVCNAAYSRKEDIICFSVCSDNQRTGQIRSLDLSNRSIHFAATQIIVDNAALFGLRSEENFLFCGSEKEFWETPNNFSGILLVDVPEEQLSVVVNKSRLKNATIIINGDTHAQVYDNACVVAKGKSVITAYGASHIVANDEATVLARGSSNVVANGKSIIEARDDAFVAAFDKSTIFKSDNAIIKVLSDNVTVKTADKSANRKEISYELS